MKIVKLLTGFYGVLAIIAAVFLAMALSGLNSESNRADISGHDEQTERTIGSTKEWVEFVKKNEEEGHLKAFTFIQETIRFDEKGKARDTSIWHEAIRYPKDFRIDFGDPEKGNANINRNDSIYVFRNNKLVHSGPEIQEFLILEGGLFYYSSEETLNRLQRLGVDTNIFTASIYKNDKVYIIGAEENEYHKPQIWVDAEHHYVVRRFSKGKQGELYEVKYDDIKNIGGHWIESWIEFYVDGKLIQTECYTSIDIAPGLNDKIFDHKYFGEVYWFKK